jgi:mannose/fructose-specific phosphotransferase system component IIA
MQNDHIQQLEEQLRALCFTVNANPEDILKQYQDKNPRLIFYENKTLLLTSDDL